MSRAYRIRVRESISRELKASDEICSDLEMLEILPCDQMAQLLKGALAERGFEEQDGKMVRKDGDITVSIDPETGEVSIRSEATEKVDLEGAREGTGYDDVGPNEASLRERLQRELKQDLERRAEQQTQRLQGQATEALEKKLADMQQELNQVVNKVTAEALKQKASQLGQIKEMTEDPENGSLTIKVEV
ncbi:hypothetical protein [Tuwongella immobilis]|uniref:FtsH ternary system domain-containing protein n=1 Tax=Tuwongella immobilis TaxID=692036 RepID=A0A6C2YL83_9BACT|nr:hypothetical protein [Tuwongella immobilis]VIP01989.1 Uncultured bacterium genome assembly Metasoil_fosmids_resub OS=uncultured bacterium PE=4 SV=1 [Tuwongella immobilis]VTS00054.1 Uncultured bacterium genome assembly Metasoil_fosmids_resub OS=uncultured bacterium PE=4 SV=1 [Tuwongella immobilis]